MHRNKLPLFAPCFGASTDGGFPGFPPPILLDRPRPSRCGVVKAATSLAKADTSGGWPWADVLVLKLSVSGNIYMKTWFFNTGVSCRCSLHLILGFFDMLCLCYPLAMKIGRNGELLFAHFPMVFSQPQPALPWDLLPSAMLITGLRNAVATGCAVACPPVVPRVATTTKRTLRRTLLARGRVLGYGE